MRFRIYLATSKPLFTYIVRRILYSIPVLIVSTFLSFVFVSYAGNPVAINMPNGQLFNTISNGYNTMMGYAAQIPHADRWAIVLYVRALQRSQNASLDDIPPDHRSGMQMPEAPTK